jgi:hypothetical protein
MTRIRGLAALAGFVVSVLFAGTALAQDYTTSYQTNASLYEAPPSSGSTQLSVAQGVGVFVNLPFEFAYCGVGYSQVWVAPHGFIQFGAASSGGSTEFSNTTWPPSGNDSSGIPLDGMVACLWDDLNPDTTFNGGAGRVVHWTSGTAPSRRWVVSWEGVPQYTGGTTSVGSVTCQIKLYEGTGRIEFGYKADSNPSTWQQLSYSAGLVAVKGGSANDTRSYPGGVVLTGPFWNQTPGPSTSNTLSGHPIRDVRFDPKSYTYSGKLQYDRLVTDGNGIGGTVQAGQALAGLGVELRRPDGSTGFRTTTDATGTFSIRGVGMNSTWTGTLAVVASSGACTVRTSPTAAATSLTVQSGVAFNANRDIGTVTIGAAADPTGANRIPFHIVRTIQTTYDWAVARTAKPIPALDVLYDPASNSPTAHTYASAGPPAVPAQLRIGSTGSANPDGWDEWVVRREYGRHVLAAIATGSRSATDTRFDAATDEENAFAEAFGSYLHAAITRATTFHDGLSASTVNSVSIDAPVLATRPGPDVAGYVAAALYDLVDPANEPWDTVDGTGAVADKPFAVAATMGGPAPCTTTNFFAAWGAAGNPGLALSRLWIHEGLVADDNDEANDDSTQPTACGSAGFRRPARTLNLYNEDWFEFDLLAPAAKVVADVSFDRSAFDTQVTLQVYDSIGAALATGAPLGQFGAFRVSTGALAPGKYRVRVRHDSGVRLPVYSVQVYVPQVVTSDPFVPWTVNRPYNVAIRATGGVPPYRLSIDQPYSKPAGITLDSVNMRFTGTPLTPGNDYFVLTTTDSGDPANVTTIGVQFRINDTFGVVNGPFVPFALGKPLARAVPTHGGTAPFQLQLVSGTLPPGIQLKPATQTFEGTADTAGAWAFRLSGSDAAGATDARDTLGVVCVALGTKPVATDLATGASACGFWVDAVAGSGLSFTVTTVKGKVKRTLAASVVDADGVDVGGTAKSGLGRATVTKLVAPRSGRYFCIVSSPDGEATQVQCLPRVAPPVKGAGRIQALVAGTPSRIEFGALAGAKLTFKVTPDRSSGAKATVLTLIDPLGVPQNLATIGKLTTVKNGATLTATLPTSGTWTAVVGALPGPESNYVSWSFAIKQSKSPYDADAATSP